MAEKVIYAGDSYAIRRPLFTISFVDDLGAAFDLSGCTVRTTFKPALKSIAQDPLDDTAVIKHTIVIAMDGSVTSQNGLFLKTTAAAGAIDEHLTATESRILPVDTTLYGDAELTDANGEIFTWLFTDTLRVVNVVTNRTS